MIARVNHPKNAWLFDETWGVDVAMSPPHILASLTEEAVSVGDVVRLMNLEHGKVTLVELTLPPSAPLSTTAPIGCQVFPSNWPGSTAQR